MKTLWEEMRTQGTTYCLGEQNHGNTEARNHGKPNTMSPRFFSKRQRKKKQSASEWGKGDGENYKNKYQG